MRSASVCRKSHSHQTVCSQRSVLLTGGTHKMEKFAYASPTSEKDALALLSNTWGETAILAGGTDLLSMMKDNVAAPKTLVNIKSIKSLGGFGTGKLHFRIGA